MQLENNQQRSEESHNKDSFVYKFKQQIIQAWRPVPTTRSSIILYLVLFIFFITVGVIILVYTSEAQKFEMRYDTTCTSFNTSCTLTFNITNKISAPVFLYYGVKNFYQNHNKFMKYKRNSIQLAGQQYPSVDAARADCGNKVTNKDMGWTKSVNGTNLNPDDIAYPCGMVAYSLFNDTFSISGITISNSGIAWPQDAQQYKNWDLSKQGLDLTNQNWLVWSRPAVTSNFYKLWGKINQDILPNTYIITIQNNYNVAGFGEKSFVLANANVFGDYNTVLGVGYIIGAGLSLILLIAFIIMRLKQNVEESDRASKRRQ